MPSFRARASTHVEIEAALRRIGDFIRRERLREGLTLAKLADRCLVSIPTMRKVERGDPTVGLGVIACALWQLGLGDRVVSCLAALGEDERPHARRASEYPGRGF
jgi:hypothetical protein